MGPPGIVVLDVVTAVIAFAGAWFLWQVHKQNRPHIRYLKHSSISIGAIGVLQLVRAITRFFE